MASDISLTSGMRTNLLQLQSTSKLMDRTQERIATGKKVNSALDDPSAFFAAKSLTDRATDLSALKDSMGQAVNTIKAADEGIEAITALVQQAKGLTQSALASNSTTERKSLAAQFDDLLGEINKLAVDTSYGGKNLINGRGTVEGGTGGTEAVSKAKIESIAGINTATFDDLTGVTTEQYYNVSISQQTYDVTQSSLMAATAFSSSTGVTALTFDFSGSTSDADVSIAYKDANTVTVTQGTESFDVALDASGLTDLAVNTAVEIGTGTLNGGTISVKVTTDNTYNSGADAFSLDAGATTVTNTSAAANARTVTVTNATTSTDTDSQTLADGDVTFSLGGGQYDMTLNFTAASVDTKAINAGNLKAEIVGGEGGSDMKVVFNEDSSHTITVEAATATTAGLGLSNATNDWADNSDVNTAVSELSSSLSQLRSFSQGFANDLAIVSTREEFTNQLTNVLEEGADKLTLADQNEEGANLLMLQTRQSLGTTSLSIASQSAQAILRLF